MRLDPATSTTGFVLVIATPEWNRLIDYGMDRTVSRYSQALRAPYEARVYAGKRGTVVILWLFEHKSPLNRRRVQAQSGSLLRPPRSGVAPFSPGHPDALTIYIALRRTQSNRDIASALTDCTILHNSRKRNDFSLMLFPSVVVDAV